ncbi:related to ASG1 - activator of stress genes [Melanopsichium pennsylvanicum]|uniref:Related to ASG1 - activator of stress genes n=2 Tax=Melanopsichium pennsylvanicum TaxID=63383 RepID=A0AAJ4XSP3_9BASI|nr:c6 transcription factor [Melanopsichium pennsylvanicum 4]SNX87147.1 related to ASG1 - activator of stress genes [Melanopsichium pennsylvanicum]
MKNSRPHIEATSSAAANASQVHHHDSPSDDPKIYTRGMGKRNRVHFACTECYRRKQKCDRETPCQHCIARKIPERCKTFQPGEETNDVASRLSRVERILEEYLPRLAHQVQHIASGTQSSPHTHAKLALGSRFQHARSQSSSEAMWLEASDQAVSPDQMQARSNDQDDDDIDELETDGRYSPKTGFYNGGSMDMRISSILDDLPGSSTKSTPLNLPIRTLEGPSDLDVVMPEYGCPTAPTPDLLGAFSTRAHCSVLIDHFFNEINWMRQPLPQRSLRKSFEAFWNTGPKINASNINIFALLCNVCAIAMLSVEHSLFSEGPRDRLKAARRYHYAGRRALLMSSIMGREDVDQIAAWLASCRFLLLDRRIGEAYTLGSSAVRAAFSIGLHRDGTKLGLSPAETEARRRVWASVYFLDRALALNTGRPAVIDDRVCDTQVPSGAMDEDIFPAPKHPPKMPEGVDPPTAYSYTVFRQRIAELEGHILATFQNLQTPVHVSEVLALDKDMRELQDNLPFYFRARLTKNGVECDKSLDSTYGFLNVHRFLLHTEINSVRIALHRPYLLRSGGPNGAKFLPCREASLNAALHDLEMRSDFVSNLKRSKVDDKPMLLYRVQIGTYKYFHSLLVVGVILLMDPSAPEAPKLKSHLEHYVNSYQRRPASQRDEMRDREANVIGIFLSRIEQVEKMGTLAKGAAPAKIAATRATKRGRSSDAGHRSETTDTKASKRGRDTLDEKSDAHLLLGLGAEQSSEQSKEAGSEANSGAVGARARLGASSSTASELATSSPRLETMSVPSSVSDVVKLSGKGSAPRPGSGEWTYNPRGLSSAVGASSSGSNSSSPSTPLLPAVLPAANAVGDSLTTASSTPSVAPASNGGGEDAQQFFDAWYQAEWAAATLPSYDAAYNGANGVGGGAAGVSLGLDSLGGLGGVFASAGKSQGSSGASLGQGLGGGFNGLGGPSIGSFGPGTSGASGSHPRLMLANGIGLTPNAVMSGWTSQGGYAPEQTSSTNPLADFTVAAQPVNNADSAWQQQHQQQRNGPSINAMQGQAARMKQSAAMGAPGTSVQPFAPSGFPMAGTATPQADHSPNMIAFESQGQEPSYPAGAGQQNFDPAFWQTLIDKIIT